ncbi:MAG: respiratory nitrate reductase subunit gamma [Fibrobacteria bacterium]|nr:respiratory nitrate reductase subunit gamma [Fibrobacteria bacterium]
MPGSLLMIILYLAVAVFVVGLIKRGLKIAKLPIHLRWELSPVPHEKGKASYGGSYLEEFEWWTKPREKSLLNEFWYMFLEIIFLKGVWENNRRMWYFSFPFHFGGLYLVVVAVALFKLSAFIGFTGTNTSAIASLAIGVSVIAYGLGAFGVIGLCIQRLTDPVLKPFTTPSHIINLVFLGSIYVSGLAAIFSISNYAAQMTGFIQGMVTFSPPALPGIMGLHVILASAFLIYLPFTYMMHFVAKYFTYHEIRWNDTPMPGNDKMEKEVGELLSQSPTWSAPHLKADGKKTWVDIATEEMDK